MGVIDRFKYLFKQNKPELDIEKLVRASVVNPNAFRHNKNQRILPDEQKFYGFQRLDLEELNSLPRAKAINFLIKTNDSLKFAVDTYIDYTVPEFAIRADDERDYQIIENWINNFPKGKAGYIKYLKQLAYGRYVEGGIASEMITGKDGMPSKAVYVSPWTLEAELRDDDGGIGEHYVIGQRQQSSSELTVLEDESGSTPDLPNFIYLPAHQNGDDPFGSSQVAPALFSVSAMQQFLSDIVNWTQGKVFPKHIYHLDIQALSDAGYTTQQIATAQALANDVIKGALDGADITEDIILSVPVVPVLVGAMERAGLDGGEMIVDIFERQQQRGLKIPRVLYGSRRQSGSGLNDRETQVEWFSFFKRIYPAMDDIEAVQEYHISEVLMMNGSTGSGSIMLDRSDPLLAEYEATLFDMQMKGFQTISEIRGQNENGASIPLFTAEELRKKIIMKVPDFNDLDFELPDDLASAEMVMPMIPEPNEPDNDSDDDME